MTELCPVCGAVLYYWEDFFSDEDLDRPINTVCSECGYTEQYGAVNSVRYASSGILLAIAAVLNVVIGAAALILL